MRPGLLLRSGSGIRIHDLVPLQESDVRGAYVHDLKNADRIAVDLSDEAIAGAEATVAAAADRLRSGDFSANPGDRCRRCDVRQMCASART